MDSQLHGHRRKCRCGWPSVETTLIRAIASTKGTCESGRKSRTMPRHRLSIQSPWSKNVATPPVTTQEIPLRSESNDVAKDERGAKVPVLRRKDRLKAEADHGCWRGRLKLYHQHWHEFLFVGCLCVPCFVKEIVRSSWVSVVQQYHHSIQTIFHECCWPDVHTSPL